MGEAVISNVLMRLAKWPQSSHRNDWVDIMESYLEYYKRMLCFQNFFELMFSETR